MSKNDKFRDKLASIQKNREDYEKQKRELENEMSIGRQNMGKIQKGLKNNGILDDTIVLEPVSVPSSEKTTASSAFSNNAKRHSGSSKNGFNISSGTTNSNNIGLTSAHLQPYDPHNPSAPSTSSTLIPTGTRISDWCYTGPLESSPPIVKSRELYENVRLLGRGAFGEVHLTKNMEDHKLFAIKTIFCAKESELRAVLKEIRLLRFNQYPFVIDVQDAFITSNPRVVHIVMHYCESGTLATIISNAKKNKQILSEQQITRWIVQLTLAINFLHENHCIHRDLKPMNVMLTEGGDMIKLADFGLAVLVTKEEEEGSGQGAFVDEAGTPYYTAPEIITRESYSYPADCWSFGIIFYQLLTCERPFDGHNTNELVKSILTADPPPIQSHYSDELKSLCLSLLIKSPAERMSARTMITETILTPKCVNYPNSYRPKYLEERLRRYHIKQIELQLNRLNVISAVPPLLSANSMVLPNGISSATTTPRGPGMNSASGKFSKPKSGKNLLAEEESENGDGNGLQSISGDASENSNGNSNTLTVETEGNNINNILHGPGAGLRHGMSGGHLPTVLERLNTTSGSFSEMDMQQGGLLLEPIAHTESSSLKIITEGTHDEESHTAPNTFGTVGTNISALTDGNGMGGGGGGDITAESSTRESDITPWNHTVKQSAPPVVSIQQQSQQHHHHSANNTPSSSPEKMSDKTAPRKYTPQKTTISHAHHSHSFHNATNNTSSSSSSNSTATATTGQGSPNHPSNTLLLPTTSHHIMKGSVQINSSAEMSFSNDEQALLQASVDDIVQMVHITSTRSSIPNNHLPPLNTSHSSHSISIHQAITPTAANTPSPAAAGATATEILSPSSSASTHGGRKGMEILQAIQHDHELEEQFHEQLRTHSKDTSQP